MSVTATLEADLATVTDAVGIAPVTVVALPPSSLDPAADKMRVYVSGVLVVRDYDPLVFVLPPLPPILPPAPLVGVFDGGDPSSVATAVLDGGIVGSLYDQTVDGGTP